MNDFLEWPLARQEATVREVCRILDKSHIPYTHKRINRPARSLTAGKLQFVPGHLGC